MVIIIYILYVCTQGFICINKIPFRWFNRPFACSCNLHDENKTGIRFKMYIVKLRLLFYVPIEGKISRRLLIFYLFIKLFHINITYFICILIYFNTKYFYRKRQ